ncbi:ABC transporter ATP-binding protein [Alkalitalea saponilacus]|uniref:Phospholipid/cholesterol/gamma-HCH transport system ATP-binding protein n=1 Tax=Alkalitalea saponilacus TaxID=889453 RepID=A0A1T5HMD1_9BACT|nr:ATP-binding cassette domain-containing protein [Alkalitalea saponilacus]ASB49404.1 ABC transporter ATP-binding protein [Alkalitalea saponilacus]SKC21816.1 phospholipid/cholesterol/gamma-HCH transport system ATP-binding protein [Alkalitalea saponilacus]
MIEARNIIKSFDGKTILKDVSAVFKPGQTNLIIGQSGSGKTVFLKSLVGLHEVDSGDILYDDRDFTRMPDKDRIKVRQEMGMLFQGSALFDSLTVEENVRFPLDMFTKQKLDERRERANFCLKRVNLENVNHLYPSEISGGMQKRVAIARAIALNPRYLFCDEPNSGLDPKTAIVIDELIQEITKEYNMTTIVNTHDMNSVLGIGEHIIFIFNGEKYWEGSSQDIFQSDNKELNDFIFASKFFRKIKDKL